MFKFLVKYYKKINFLLSIYYSFLYKGIVIVGKAKINNNGGKIVLSKGSKLFLGIDFTYQCKTIIDLYEGSQIVIDGNVKICRGCKIVWYKNSKLNIKDNTYINECSRIHCTQNISIGKNCAIAFDTTIMDSDLHIIYKNNTVINNPKSISIGNNVWIGTKTIILKGSFVDNNVIIASSSLVTKNLYSNKIYAGNPIHEISSFDKWK